MRLQSKQTNKKRARLEIILKMGIINKPKIKIDNKSIRVVVADDSKLMRQSCSWILLIHVIFPFGHSTLQFKNQLRMLGG